MNSGTDYRRALVASQFHRARRRAAVESLLARLSGQPLDLLSFNEVVDKLGISGQSALGLRQIPLEAIVGSVGRYQDFTRTFLPRMSADEDRWIRVGAVSSSVANLPPIEVYKIDNVYFVLDGNHRVSLARQQNLDYIDANVIEVRTRAPLPFDLNADGLIIAAEQATFLEYTRLDRLRPGADVRVSVPGQYRHLESHIEAYRLVLEEGEGCDIPFEQAVERWHDELYLPLVEAIREQGILRYFPNRTETDFFIWLSRHRAELQNELGYTITPDVTVTRLLSRIKSEAQENPSGLMARLRRLTPTSLGEAAQVTERTWAEERTLDRYSDHLFATILYPVIIDAPTGRLGPAADTFARAVALSREEEATLCALCILAHPPNPTERAAIDALRHSLMSGPARGKVVTEIGPPLHWTKEVGFLNDLVIIERTFDEPAGRDSASDGARLSPTARAIIEQLERPILVMGSAGGAPFPGRVLVVHDTRRRLDEAVFIAAYLAERWGAELAMLPLSNGRNTFEIVAGISEYLALHEVSATFLEPVRPDQRAVEPVIQAAEAGAFDLLLLTGPDRGRKTSRQNYMKDVVWALLQRWPHSTLIAT
ncbi:MAG: hypothetical protein KA170_00865 [Candidatus Promineofilum sp.]|nr:hypothetical protein [Promineifilum sp.]